jgi:hypothetical protein
MKEPSVGDTQCLDLLREAQVAVAIAATTSNPEWIDLWKRIQEHLERRDAGTRTRWEQAEVYLARAVPLLLNPDRAEAAAELASMAENLNLHDEAYWGSR